ncbi:MAG: sigma factor [Eubacteriales bacterium]|nr:sigma factor [Eubacteriales bacterium]
MKNNYSIAERNRIVEENLFWIDRIIRRNTSLMQAAHLDYDDVYQDLAVRLIQCVESYDPSKGKLDQHIMCQLQYEMLNCKSSQRRYGFTAAPYDLRGAVISLDAFREDGNLHADEPVAA